MAAANAGSSSAMCAATISPVTAGSIAAASLAPTPMPPTRSTTETSTASAAGDHASNDSSDIANNDTSEGAGYNFDGDANYDFNDSDRDDTVGDAVGTSGKAAKNASVHRTSSLPLFIVRKRGGWVELERSRLLLLLKVVTDSHLFLFSF